MDQTPITVQANSTLQLAVSMFQKLGLRYLLLVDRGSLKGLLTKKDIWWVLNASEAQKKSATFVPGTGLLREQDSGELERDEEAEGLLNNDT